MFTALTKRAALSVVLASVCAGAAARPAGAQLVLDLADYALAPMTGEFGGEANLWPVARINVMRAEPGHPNRMFIVDLNGPLYLFDTTTKTFSPYLDFNGRDGRPGLFERFTFLGGWANGLITVQFDPAYTQNGRFYTIHLEEPQLAVPAMPVAGAAPGLDLTGYALTEPEPVEGAVERHGVLIEWTDTDTSNATFEGRAREIIRFALNTRIHPPGDMVFNPAAEIGDPDWRVMYLAVGDSGSGEQRDERRHNPQRLDQLVGKILRIVPDPETHEATSAVAPNGRYRIPADNPFVDRPGARGEIWALGMRNPHRLWWDADPADASKNRLLALHIGQHTWESVYVVERGANFGYSEREGNQALRPTDNQTQPLPTEDRIPLRIDATTTDGLMTPTYPVLQYSHAMGLAIASGVVYRGSRVPELQGKFIFGDIVNGRLWYADYAAMLAAHDGKPSTLAPLHEIRLRWTPPGSDVPTEYPTMRLIAAAGFEARRAADPAAGAAPVPARTDMRIAVDAEGELYITTKTDGAIRAIVSAAVMGGS